MNFIDWNLFKRAQQIARQQSRFLSPTYVSIYLQISSPKIDWSCGPENYALEFKWT